MYHRILPRFLALSWLPVTLLAAGIVGVLIAAATAQSTKAGTDKPAPKVTWENHVPGWFTIIQHGQSAEIGLRRASVQGVARYEANSIYATTVYHDTSDLVVILVGSKEWRVRCPDEKTAKELAQFIALGPDK